MPPTVSFSTVDRRQRHTSSGPCQVIGTTHSIPIHPLELHRYSQPPHNRAHFALGTNDKQRDASSTLPEVDESFSEDILTAIYQPPAIPNWSQLFDKWLQARRRWMVDRGSDDPILLRLPLTGVFDAWLQPRWPLLHNQGLGDPIEDPSRWAHLFDFWLLMPDTQELLAVHQPLSPPVQAPTNLSIVPAPIPSPAWPSTAIFTRTSRRKSQNTVSVRTVVEIQQNCEKRGGEKGAIQKLEIVFPANIVVSRDALKVKKRSKGRLCGSTRNHYGYLEFVGPREGKHYCRLCGSASKLWKNEKDLLNHVWNTHCDY
jgi:hypothetical protein